MRIAILTLCILAGCADEPPPTVAASSQGLVCDPNCDPGNFQYLVSQVVGAAWGLGTQIPGSMQCHHYREDVDDGHVYPAHDECSGIWQDPWGQQYLVHCSNTQGCDHRACGWPTDPNQYACR